MERNQNDNLDSGTFGGSTTGAGSSGSTGNLESGFEGSGAGTGAGYGGSSGLGNSGSQGYGAGISGASGVSGDASGFGSGAAGYGGGLGGSDQSFADRAKSGLGTAREKASELKATLADKLEAGAQKLRSQQQPGGGDLAGAGVYGSTASVGAQPGKMGQVNDKLAQGMQSTAEFLRNADLDSMKSGIEKQVRENPGRTLLIAAGIGYLLGKAFRK